MMTIKKNIRIHQRIVKSHLAMVTLKHQRKVAHQKSALLIKRHHMKDARMLHAPRKKSHTRVASPPIASSMMINMTKKTHMKAAQSHHAREKNTSRQMMKVRIAFQMTQDTVTGMKKPELSRLTSQRKDALTHARTVMMMISQNSAQVAPTQDLLSFWSSLLSVVSPVLSTASIKRRPASKRNPKVVNSRA